MCGLASAIHRASASVTANARRRSATSSATRAAAATAATRRGAETKCATHASRAAERRSAALERSFLSFSGVFVATLRAATRDSRSRRAFERSSRLLGVAASIFRRAVTLLPARSRQACVAATSARLLRKLSAKLPTCAARSRSRTATRHCPKAPRAAARRCDAAASASLFRRSARAATLARHENQARAVARAPVNVTTTESSSKNRPSLRKRVSNSKRAAEFETRRWCASAFRSFSRARRAASPSAASAARAGAAAFLRHTLAQYARRARASAAPAANTPSAAFMSSLFPSATRTLLEKAEPRNGSGSAGFSGSRREVGSPSSEASPASRVE